MILHIATRRNIALDLIERGFITQAEAAQLLGESRQAVRYMARDIDAKAARAKYLDNLWGKETLRPPRKKRQPLKRKEAQQ
jgi:predicted transcriptional regulator